MSLLFITGRASRDHFSTIMHLINKNYTSTDHYFYLVPNHIKFKSEIKTLEYLRKIRHLKDESNKNKGNSTNDYAQINVQTLSLTRMGWFFFNKQIMPQHQQISDPGINMLLYTIIKENVNELWVFNHEIGQTGFILKIAQEINEMQTSQISAKTLQTLYESLKNINQDNDLTNKMHDFLIIYKIYEHKTHNKYISKAGVLERLCGLFTDSKYDWDEYLRHCHFYISGFSQFTAQENQLVQILIQKSASVVIDLDIDERYLNGKKNVFGNKQVSLSPYDLFYRPYRLYKRLLNFAKDSKIPPYKTESNNKKNGSHDNEYCILAYKPLKKQINPDLLTLEDYWIDAYQKHFTPGQFKETLNHPDSSIQVFQADNTYSELAHVAIKIRQMVATQGYRYSDFLILTRHLDKFSNVIKPIFHCQQIPIFNDLQRQMMLHPLVRLIGDLFSIYHLKNQRKYTYHDVMDLLKTGLLIPKDNNDNYMSNDEYYHDLYLCENCVLQNGYWGDEWLQKKPWRYDHYDDFTHKIVLNQDVNQRVNRIKKFVRVTLTNFFDQLDQAKNCQDACTDLYQFLVENGVCDQLKQWRKEEIEDHQLDYASRNTQVWSVFCNLLDDCVDTLGKKEKFNDDFTISDFWSLLKAGFESASYSQVPPTFDQVVISESKIVQMKDYRVVFMIGSTNDVMPDTISNNTLFSNTDRTKLKPLINDLNEKNRKLNKGTKSNFTQYYLNDGSKAQTNNEPYLNYLAFMSATQKVIFTYSLKGDDENSGGIQESPYIEHMQEAFNIKTKRFGIKPSLLPISKNKYQLSSVDPYLGSPLGTLHHLIQAQHVVADLNSRNQISTKSKFRLSNAWQYIKQLLLNSQWHNLTKRLLSSINYRNDPKRIDPKIADQLYVDINNKGNLITSISQLETFYRNPYEYFLKYGLRLKPRQVMGHSALSDFGQFYHAALKNVLLMIKRNSIDLTKFSLDHLRQDVDRVVNDLANGARGNKYEILQSSARMGYVKNILRNTIWNMVYTIFLQAKNYTQLRPLYMELPFKTQTKKNSSEKLLRPLEFKVYSKYRDKDHKIHKERHELQVNGQIDRVDYLKTKGNNRQYYGIVDYKSSPHRFDYGQIFAGTQMQMMTYLDALYRDLQAKGFNKEDHVFGALYSLIQSPCLEIGSIKDVNKINDYSNDPWKLLLQQQQYNGLLIGNTSLPKVLDKSLSNGKSSSIMYNSLKTTKSGNLNKRSQYHYLISNSDFQTIRHWTEDKIKAAGKAIYDGDIKLKPAKWGKQNALSYSPYKSIMCFDPLLPDNKYNVIKSIKTPKGLIKNINEQAKNGKEK